METLALGDPQLRAMREFELEGRGQQGMQMLTSNDHVLSEVPRRGRASARNSRRGRRRSHGKKPVTNENVPPKNGGGLITDAQIYEAIQSARKLKRSMVNTPKTSETTLAKKARTPAPFAALLGSVTPAAVADGNTETETEPTSADRARVKLEAAFEEIAEVKREVVIPPPEFELVPEEIEAAEASVAPIQTPPAMFVFAHLFQRGALMRLNNRQRSTLVLLIVLSFALGMRATTLTVRLLRTLLRGLFAALRPGL